MSISRQRIRGIGQIPRVPERDDDLDDLLRALPDAPSDLVSMATEIPLLLEAAEERGGDDDAALREALSVVGLADDDAHVRALRRIIRRGPAS
jgi:hypothetical protein